MHIFKRKGAPNKHRHLNDEDDEGFFSDEGYHHTSIINLLFHV